MEEEGRTIINVVISIVQFDPQYPQCDHQYCVISIVIIIITVAMQVEDECGDIPMVLVQNKIDLISQSEINQ